MSMFREAPSADGKPGPVSIRRVLAAFFSLSAVSLGAVAIPNAPGWYVFIPSVACLAGALLLMFFTTWSDVAAVISASKGISSKPLDPCDR
jgi:hypothetical protein